MPQARSSRSWLLIGLTILPSIGEPDPVEAQSDPVTTASFQGRLELDVDRGRIGVRWTVELVPSDPDTAAFLLNRGLDVEAWRSEAALGLEVTPWREGSDWNRVVLPLKPDVDPGESIRVRIDYSGTPVWPRDGMNGISPEWVELSVDSAWHPIPEGFDRPLVGTLDVRLPVQWTAASSGRVERRDGALRIRQDSPRPDVAFTASPTWETRTSGRFRVAHTGDQDPRSLETLLETAEACARRLDARYGGRDSVSHGWFVIAPREDGGYARGNYVVLTDLRGFSPSGLSAFVCHELAHTWATGAPPLSPENWLNEGFAEYLAARFVRDRHGVEAFEEMLTTWRDAARDQPPVWTPDATGRPGFRVSYRKAPLLLHRLSERMGEEAFDRLLVEFLTDPSRDSTPELLDLVESVAGPSTRVWFEAELAR